MISLEVREAELIERAQAGDTGAFEALISDHATYIYNVALRMLEDPFEAEDLAQEALVRVWRALPGFRSDARFTTWLYRIVVNLCYNRLPRLRRELEALSPDETVLIGEGAGAVETAVSNGELRAAIYAAVDELPDTYRLLITLRHLQGLSYNEIAEATDMPLGTVKTVIFRARRQLRSALVDVVDNQPDA